MRYALTKRVSLATGALADDPMPAHLECGEMLRLVAGQNPLASSSQWQCLHCFKKGALVLVDEEPVVDSTATERMRPRWERGTPTHGVAKGLESVSRWDEVLTRYFKRGLWVMAAHDDPERTIPDDSPLWLGRDIRCRSVEGGGIEIAILDANDDRWHLLLDVVAIHEHTQGILVAVTAAGGCLRLDSHLTVPDEQYVAHSRLTWG